MRNLCIRCKLGIRHLSAQHGVGSKDNFQVVDLSGVRNANQIVLTREGMLDVMTVEIEAAPDSSVADGDRGGLPKKVGGDIKSLIGVTCNVVIKSPGEVPRSQGKAARVKVKRKR